MEIPEFQFRIIRVHSMNFFYPLLIICWLSRKWGQRYFTFADKRTETIVSSPNVRLYTSKKKYMKDEKFLKTDEVTYQKLHLNTFPNFHASGNIEGMRNLYYGKDAFLVQAGNFIYHVDEDTFHAVKDNDFIREQPKWLTETCEQLTEAAIEHYRQTITVPAEKEIDESKQEAIRSMLETFGLKDYSIEEVKEIAKNADISLRDTDLARKVKDAMYKVALINDDFLPKYEKNAHELTVMALATKADMMKKMLERMDKAVTAVQITGGDAAGRMFVSCKIDGVQQQTVTVSAEDREQLRDLLPKGFNETLKELAAQYNAQKLFEPLFKMEEAEYRQVDSPVVSAMDDDHILATADKIGAVLERFYSLHEVNELTRIITDPDKGVEDVKAAMSVIFQRNKAQEEMVDAKLARISHAMFIPSEKDGLCISVEIDGLLMPFKKLDNGDAEDIGKIDKTLLKQHELDEMAADLALKYYEKELKMPCSDLVMIAQQTDLTLTKADARTFVDLDRALEQKFPDGLTLAIPDFTATDLYCYVQYGKFRDEDFVFAGIGEQVPEHKDFLKAEVTLPKEKLLQLVPAPDEYSNESYEDFINDLDNAEAFDASTTELMHRHPDLDGAKFTLYDHSIPKFMRIEGQLLDNAVAWVLQKPDINEETLRKVLNDKKVARELLDNIAATKISDYDRQRTAKMGMPEGLDMVRNNEKLYLYEKGTLAFAEVDRMRGVRYNGETMSQAAQSYINDLAANKNIEVRGRNTFFMMSSAESEKKAYLDTMNDKLVTVEIQKDIFGNTLHTDGTKVLHEVDMFHYQDITGRITDAHIIGIDKPMVRCKIDGVQQSGRDLTKADRIKAGHFFSNSEAMNRFALSMAVKHFATELYDSPEQKQSKGMKR